MDAWTALASGFSTGSALIVAIGAQNAFVLRQGLRREHVRLVVAICAASDAVLIQIGTRGVGAAVALHPSIDLAMRCLGALWLAVYGLLAVRRASSPAMLQTATSGSASDWPRVAITTLALTWLNPHVYIDTMVLLGSIANSRGPADRWWFAVRALVASTLWFVGLGFGARFAAPLLTTPRAWQVLDLLIAATMLAVAAKLAF